MPDQSILTVDDLHIRFGGNPAVDGVSFDIETGSVVGLVGPNGAGKTTLFNAVSGLVSAAQGRITYNGVGQPVDLVRVGAWRRARLGIGRTFQDSRLVGGLPVVDQLLTGACAARTRMVGAVLRTPGFIRAERELVERAHAVLAALHIDDKAFVSVDLLSAPERRLVDLGRALMMRPQVLLLDEISAGMPPEQRTLVAEAVVAESRRHGTTVLFVEHDMAFVRSIAHRVVVMATGRIIADGGAEDVLRRQDVLEAYIGQSAAAALQ